MYCFIVLVLAGLGIVGTMAAEVETPNVVVFFVDDLGYGDLGCFGHPTIRTPHLDRMASEGQKWTEFYVIIVQSGPSFDLSQITSGPSSILIEFDTGLLLPEQLLSKFILMCNRNLLLRLI